MSDEQDKKKQEKLGAEKHKENILEMIGGIKGVEQYIEGFSQNSEHAMTDQQKEYMKTYALDIAEKWGETILKMEQALKNPEVVSNLEKRFKSQKHDKSDKAKE